MAEMIFKVEQQFIKLALDDILYIQTHVSKPHYVTVVTELNRYDTPDSLARIENNYGAPLARCHRNYLVNVKHISTIDIREKKAILGDSGRYHIPYSRRHYRSLIEKWSLRGEG